MLTPSDFTEFINNSLYFNKEEREALVSTILNFLGHSGDPSKRLPEDLQKKFTFLISNVFQNKDLLKYCQTYDSIAKDTINLILKVFEQALKQIFKEDPYDTEKTSLITQKEMKIRDFFDNLPFLFSDLSKQYSKDQMDLEFYENKFLEENLKSEEKNARSKAFKQKILEEWEQLIKKKEDMFHLQLIDQERKRACEELYKKIEQFKKLQKVLTPFTDQMGRLWDLSKGLWKDINFNVLEKYAEILEKEKELQALAEELGRMQKSEEELEKEIFQTTEIKQYYKIDYAAKSEFVGIHESGDLSYVVPMELGLLTNPVTEYLFYVKFADKKLLTYRLQGEMLDKKEEKVTKSKSKPTEKKGPIIICIDTSGSMHGTPEYVAKVLCFAIVRIAMLDSRKCYLISFSTGIQTFELSDLGKSIDQLVRFLSFSFGGGTDATPALIESLKMIETENYKNADILMISDFIMDCIPDDIVKSIENAKKKKTRLHSLIISSEANPKTLEIFTNNWVYRTDISSSMKSILKNLRFLNKINDIET